MTIANFRKTNLSVNFKIVLQIRKYRHYAMLVWYGKASLRAGQKSSRGISNWVAEIWLKIVKYINKKL